MKVLIATKNKGKVEGAKRAFDKFFDDVEVVGISAESKLNSYDRSTADVRKNNGLCKSKNPNGSLSPNKAGECRLHPGR